MSKVLPVFSSAYFEIHNFILIFEFVSVCRVQDSTGIFDYKFSLVNVLVCEHSITWSIIKHFGGSLGADEFEICWQRWLNRSAHKMNENLFLFVNPRTAGKLFKCAPPCFSNNVYGAVAPRSAIILECLSVVVICRNKKVVRT